MALDSTEAINVIVEDDNESAFPMTFDNLRQHQNADLRITTHLADGQYQLQDYAPGKQLAFYNDKVVLPKELVQTVSYQVVP